MLKLVFETLDRHGWHRVEENFTAGEARACVEIARSHEANAEKFRNVCVYDFREVKGTLVTLAPTEDAVVYNVKVVSEIETKLPAATLLDLTKLPRVTRTAAKDRIRLLGIVADVETFTPKAPKRVSKRERKFATEAALS
jgi:hypothetical protein